MTDTQPAGTPAPGTAQRVDIGEFRRTGYLQELNRQFLHPLGLALEIAVDPDGTQRFGGVWDYRDDPEGIRYAPGVIDPVKAERVDQAQRRMADSRVAVLGYVVQPVEPAEPAPEPAGGKPCTDPRCHWCGEPADEHHAPPAPEPAIGSVLIRLSGGRCGCCAGRGDHPCGHECSSCDGSGLHPDSSLCRVPHGADCRCAPEPAGDGPGPYATWDPSKATDEPDGLPDRAIVPLVESLRARGIVTLQSCAGHSGSDDGTLWVRADSVNGAHIRLFLAGEPFDRVQYVHWPEPRWEFIWQPGRAEEAIQALGGLLPAVADEQEEARAEVKAKEKRIADILRRLNEARAEVERLRGDGIDPATIPDQQAKGWPDWHPEDYCHRCGHRNIGWYADSAIWNEVHGGSGPIWCPVCFAVAYEQKTGRRVSWRLAPADKSDEVGHLIQSEAAMRHELAEVTADRDRLDRGLKGALSSSYAEQARLVQDRDAEQARLVQDRDAARNELATARRDAAAEALDDHALHIKEQAAKSGGDSHRRGLLRAAYSAEHRAAEIRAGTRPVPGSPEPAPAGGEEVPDGD